MRPCDNSAFYFAVLDDSDVDVDILRRSFKDTDFAARLRHYTSAKELYMAMESTGFNPALILLDLSLPGTDGRDVLRILQDHPTMSVVPVIVFSSSDNVRDVRFCYEHGASAYMRKPNTIEGYEQIATALKNFWCQHVILPLWPKGLALQAQ